jgi:predicted nucleotidyltransferase
MRKKTLIEELIEVSDPELDDKIVKSFHKKTELSSDIFEKNDYGYTMNKGIREKLMSISDAFLDFVKINFFVHDVVLTGSLANYNWSEFSDIDLHIVVDFDELDGDGEKTSDSLKDIVKEFFDAKERVWNNRHDIKIKGYDVEIYVQEINQEHVSSGVYSILNNKWIVEPEYGKESIDEDKILKKAEYFVSSIDKLVDKANNGEDVESQVEKLRLKLKRFRQSGLDDGGEYSYENLTFKLLRRNGYIEKLLGLKKKLIDKKLSVEY